MGLERNREKEKKQKMKQKKDKYSDNKINVSINIGSEDLIDSNKDNQEIIDSNNQILAEEEMPSKIDKDDKLKVDISDVLLTELRGNLNEFNAKKKKLMDSKIDIPNQIFDLPDIDLKSEQDVRNLNDLIKDKTRQLDTILSGIQLQIKQPEMVTQRTPLMLSGVEQPSISRVSPFGFPAPMPLPSISRPVPLTPQRVTDYLEQTETEVNNWKVKYNSLINTSDVSGLSNLITEGREIQQRLAGYKNVEPSMVKKNLIQNESNLLTQLMNNLNNLINQLKETKDQQQIERPETAPIEQPTTEPTTQQPDVQVPETQPIDTSSIDQRLSQLQGYKNSIIPTGRAPNVIDFLNNQLDTLIDELNKAKDNTQLSSEELSNILNLKVDLDFGAYPAIKAFRIINPQTAINPTDKIELRMFDNPQLPAGSRKQFKLYVNDNVITDPNIGDIIFNRDGDLYRSQDIERSDVVPEEPQIPEPQLPTPPQEEFTEETQVITDARRNQLIGYRNNLYYTGRANIDNVVNDLKAEIDLALQDPNGFTTMDLTGGRVAEAIAWKTSFPNMNPRDSSGNIEFEQIPPRVMAGGEGADPAFYLKIDNQYVTRPNSSTRRSFNRFGGMYVGNDQLGFDPRLEFPFGNLPQTAPAPEIPTEPWSEQLDDNAELAYLQLYNRDLVNIPPREIQQLSLVRPMIPFDPEDESGGGQANYYYLRINGVDNPRYRFTLDTIQLIETPQSISRPFPVGNNQDMNIEERRPIFPPLFGLEP